MFFFISYLLFFISYIYKGSYPNKEFYGKQHFYCLNFSIIVYNAHTIFNLVLYIYIYSAPSVLLLILSKNCNLISCHKNVVLEEKA